MKYGKIVKNKVCVAITVKDDGTYEGSKFRTADGKLKKAAVVIAEQNLKPIHFADGVDDRRIQDYVFVEKTSRIEVSNTLTEEAASAIAERELAIIRRSRQTECFVVINRGQLWHDALSTEQRAELAAWYSAWLDAPQTKVIPTKPAWL